MGLARHKLGQLPRSAADEEDVALSAFDSFIRGAEQGRFPRLEDREDLWQILVLITCRKAVDLRDYHERACRDWRRIQSEAANGGLLRDLIAHEPSPDFAAEIAEECKRLLAVLPNDHLRRISGGKDNFAGSGYLDQGHNLCDDSTGASVAGFSASNGDVTGANVNAGLSSTLQINQGGQTKTYALLTGSKAIGGGDSYGGSVNQNGHA